MKGPAASPRTSPVTRVREEEVANKNTMVHNDMTLSSLEIYKNKTTEEESERKKGGGGDRDQQRVQRNRSTSKRSWSVQSYDSFTDIR